MKDLRKRKMEDCLDTILVISKEAKENHGEDSFFCAENEYAAIVSVFDGCGGLGARTYQSFQGKTGAYMASRMVSGAVHDWFYDQSEKTWPDGKTFAENLDSYIQKAYQLCNKYGIEERRILGSMVRKFPTTMALAYAEHVENVVRVHLLWAGDSRIYLLNQSGLFQLTKDDTDINDALENLFYDAPMTNLLSSDGDYQIHSRTIQLSGPAILFAATDGCFSYLPSPMEFEHTILKAIVESKSPKQFKTELQNTFAEVAGDDFTFGMMSFFFGDYQNTRSQLKNRLVEIEDKYMKYLKNECDEEQIRSLWEIYKNGYERYLSNK